MQPQLEGRREGPRAAGGGRVDDGGRAARAALTKDEAECSLRHQPAARAPPHGARCASAAVRAAQHRRRRRRCAGRPAWARAWRQAPTWRRSRFERPLRSGGSSGGRRRRRRPRRGRKIGAPGAEVGGEPALVGGDQGDGVARAAATASREHRLRCGNVHPGRARRRAPRRTSTATAASCEERRAAPFGRAAPRRQRGAALTPWRARAAQLPPPDASPYSEAARRSATPTRSPRAP